LKPVRPATSPTNVRPVLFRRWRMTGPWGVPFSYAARRITKGRKGSWRSPGLWSLHEGYQWPTERIVYATCRHARDHKGDIPDDGCDCGIYGCEDLDGVLGYGHRPGEKSRLQSGNLVQAIGVIRTLGRTLPWGSRGFRAEAVELVALLDASRLFLPLKVHDLRGLPIEYHRPAKFYMEYRRVLRIVADSYGVPIQGDDASADPESLDEWLLAQLAERGPMRARDIGVGLPTSRGPHAVLAEGNIEGALRRLLSKGLIERPRRGWYELPTDPNAGSPHKPAPGDRARS
jgi:hypothetical protein